LAGSRVDPRIKQLIDTGRLPRFLTSALLTATARHKTLEAVRSFADGSAAAYFDAVDALHAARRQAEDAMREVDVILSPAAPLPAVRHGASAELGTLGSYTIAYNVLGFPAGAVPFGEVRAGEESDRPASRDKAEMAARESERDSCGLPIAVQVAAAPYHDHVALAVMRTLEAHAP
jgi:Asp-tRNA(Asn)/Glu-tRNA(Gln) amidotransferase A subunit family amidase